MESKQQIIFWNLGRAQVQPYLGKHEGMSQLLNTIEDEPTRVFGLSICKPEIGIEAVVQLPLRR